MQGFSRAIIFTEIELNCLSCICLPPLLVAGTLSFSLVVAFALSAAVRAWAPKWMLGSGRKHRVL